MGANIIQREYQDPITGVWLPFLRENAQGKINARVRYENEYYIGSGASNTFTIQGLAVILQYGNWQDEDNIAIVAGQTVTIEFSNGGTAVSATRTITDVNAGTFYIDSVISGYTNSVFPSGALSGMRIFMDQAPASVEFDFNLSQQNNPVPDSIIDGTVNRFKVDGVDALALYTPVTMIQQGQYKSGGHVEDVTLEIESFTSGVRGISRTILIEYTFYQWGIIQDGFPEPTYYPLSPYQNIRNYTQNNNLDGVQNAVSPLTTGNLAPYNLNFANGGNPYSTSSIQWYDFQGNSISAPDYSNECTFVAVVNAPANQSASNSKYKIALTWRPIDDSRYKNKPDRLGEVLKWNVPDTVFINSVLPDPTTYTGLTDDTSRFDLTNVHYVVTASTVTISGKIIPVNMESFFSSIPDGDREITLSTSISDYLLDDDSTDRVQLILWKGDIIDAPTLGVQYPYVFNSILEDHAGNNITSNTTPNTTTNDDLLYRSRFQLLKGVTYDGVRAEIFAENDITGERFQLEEYFFDFTETQFGVQQNGVYEWNRTINRGFLLPITSDRNIVSLKRSANLDTPTLYGMEIRYGFMSRIESWIANSSVNDYFFDNTLLNNGKNQNWQRFTDGDWQLNVAYYVRRNDVDDFQIYRPKTRPFDDDSSFTYGTPVITDVNGNTYNGLVQFNTSPLLKVEIPVDFVNSYLNEWFTVQLRNYQGTTIGFISSVLDRDNIVLPNALEPVNGETKLKTNIVGNSATLEFNVNTSIVSVENVSLVVRSHTDVSDDDGAIFGNGDLIEFGNGDILVW